MFMLYSVIKGKVKLNFKMILLINVQNLQFSPICEHIHVMHRVGKSRFWRENQSASSSSRLVASDGSTVVWCSRFGTAGGRAAHFSEAGSDIAIQG